MIYLENNESFVNGITYWIENWNFVVRAFEERIYIGGADLDNGDEMYLRDNTCIRE